jgi:nucleotide-binding universal stress UspA family protein
VKTIVVGYDGSDAAERALGRAADVAKAFAARLVVVSVSKPAPLPLGPPALEPGGVVLIPGGATGPLATGGTVPLPGLEPEPSRDPERSAQLQLERARTTLMGRYIEADYVAELGTPAERLLDIADDRDADLIVVGSREHGFVERLLGRPVDEAVARHTARDVLIVH